MPARPRRCGAQPVMSSPSRSTRPESALCTPVITLNNVVLPAPFGPMRPAISLAVTLMSTAASARRPPKCTPTPSATRRGSATGDLSRLGRVDHELVQRPQQVGVAARLLGGNSERAVVVLRDIHDTGG